MIVTIRNRNYDFVVGQVFPVYKTRGWTSFDVVKKVRSLLRLKKVGHGGTLDPLAEGVLVVMTGDATKQADRISAGLKEYIAEIELGITTDTWDGEGKILQRKDPTGLSKKLIERTCLTFQGPIKQLPPMYSAVKIGGQRLYKLARRGQTVDRKPRWVTIHEIKIIDIDLPTIKLWVRCSRGTYIRTLAWDIGQKLGCGAFLKALKRTRVGDFFIEDALTIGEIEAALKRASS